MTLAELVDLFDDGPQLDDHDADVALTIGMLSMIVEVTFPAVRVVGMWTTTQRREARTFAALAKKALPAPIAVWPAHVEDLAHKMVHHRVTSLRSTVEGALKSSTSSSTVTSMATMIVNHWLDTHRP